MEENQYKISYSRLMELLVSEAELTALENGGVDNWSGWGECDWESTYEECMDLSMFEEITE